MKLAGRDFNVGDTVAYYQYDRSFDRNSDMAKVKKRFPADKFAIATGVVEDSEFAFQGFPPSLVAAMEGELGLSDKQKRSLQEAFIRLAPGAGFMKHRLERRGIAGFSDDGLRVYSDYMFHASNHYARLKNYRQMAKAIN